MATMIVRHRVADYDKWKRAYDNADWLRKENGITLASVHEDESDPNTIIVIHQFEDMEGLKQFAAALSPIMKEAGVEGKPEIWIAEDIEEVAYS